MKEDEIERCVSFAETLQPEVLRDLTHRLNQSVKVVTQLKPFVEANKKLASLSTKRNHLTAQIASFEKNQAECDKRKELVAALRLLLDHNDKLEAKNADQLKVVPQEIINYVSQFDSSLARQLSLYNNKVKALKKLGEELKEILQRPTVEVDAESEQVRRYVELRAEFTQLVNDPAKGETHTLFATTTEYLEQFRSASIAQIRQELNMLCQELEIEQRFIESPAIEAKLQEQLRLKEELQENLKILTQPLPVELKQERIDAIYQHIEETNRTLEQINIDLESAQGAERKVLLLQKKNSLEYVEHYQHQLRLYTLVDKESEIQKITEKLKDVRGEIETLKQAKIAEIATRRQKKEQLRKKIEGFEENSFKKGKSRFRAGKENC